MTRSLAVNGPLVAVFLAIALDGCGGGAGSTPGGGGSGSSVGGSAVQTTGGVAQSTGGAVQSTGGMPPSTGGTSAGGTAGSSAGHAGGGGSGGTGGSVVVAPPGGSAQAGTAGAANGGAPNGAGTGGVAGMIAQSGSDSGGSGGATGGTGSVTKISFGTSLDPQAVVNSAKELAASLAKPGGAQWRAKGDQRRTYRNAATGKDEPYRICVPSAWDGTASLPAVMFLHGAGSDENSYLDQNGKQLVKLAEEHGYLLISPKGVEGAYGNFLRLTAPFGDEAAAAALMAQVTPQTELANEQSEQDVINVLELVLAEYPVDRAAMFLAGHSMGSGGTWYIGGKYSAYWNGIAPMSGPFVQKTGYPWDAVRRLSIFVTEGTQTPSLDASHLLRDWLMSNGFMSEYKEVNADHGGMIQLVLPDIFDFFDRSR
jgi:poly(3-hydroxybutyrate) depolymerase